MLQPWDDTQILIVITVTRVLPLDVICLKKYNPYDKIELRIRVWRRLVARLNGVQEAAGSIPVTRTS